MAPFVPICSCIMIITMFEYNHGGALYLKRNLPLGSTVNLLLLGAGAVCVCVCVCVCGWVCMYRYVCVWFLLLVHEHVHEAFIYKNMDLT